MFHIIFIAQDVSGDMSDIYMDEVINDEDACMNGAVINVEEKW